MNIVRKVVVASGLAATLAFSVFASLPAAAQDFHHPTLRRAARLDREAARASAHGNYRRASRLDRRAARVGRRADRRMDRRMDRHMDRH